MYTVNRTVSLSLFIVSSLTCTNATASVSIPRATHCDFSICFRRSVTANMAVVNIFS